MAKTYVEYSELGTGTDQRGQNQFSYADIEVLNVNDIKCKGFIMNAWADVSIANQGSSDSTANKKITLTASDALQYTKIRVYRQTSSDALVDFVDGARLTESDLDTAYKQGLFVAQEVQEDAAAVGIVNTNNLTFQGTTSVDNLSATGTTVLSNLTATGTVSIPTSNFAKLFVTNSAPQTLTANTLTDVVLNDEERDNTNSFTNNTFTPPANGYYCIQGQVEVNCTDPNDLSHVEIQIDKAGSAINGTIQTHSETHEPDGDANSNYTKASVSTFAIDYLTTNQPIKLRVKANSGAGTLQIIAQRAALGIFQLA